MKSMILTLIVISAVCAAGARATPGLQLGIADSGSAYFDTDGRSTPT